MNHHDEEEDRCWNTGPRRQKETKSLSETEGTKKPSLDVLIRAALEASPEPEPATVVDVVLAGIDPFDYAHYLREAITHRIASNVGELRARNTPPIRKGVSTKQTLIREDYWPRFLQQRVFLASGYKFLAEATAPDLRQVASQRQAQAQELLFRADQFVTLADLMDKHHATHLEELDPAMGRNVLGAAA